MEYKELKKKSESDLHKLLTETRDKLRDLRFKDANKQLKNVREIREVRVTIAQILTLLKDMRSPSAKATEDKTATKTEVKPEEKKVEKKTEVKK